MDGLLYFYESKDERRKIIVQVEGGGVKRGDVACLHADTHRQATLLGDVNNQKFVTAFSSHWKNLRSQCAKKRRMRAVTNPNSGTTRIIQNPTADD